MRCDRVERLFGSTPRALRWGWDSVVDGAIYVNARPCVAHASLRPA